MLCIFLLAKDFLLFFKKSLTTISWSKVSVSEIAATIDKFDETHAFYKKNIVFTGELITLERKEAMQEAVNLGAVIKSAVSSKTHFLVVGVQDKSIVGDDGMSTKEEKAYGLKEQGHNIKILSEREFLRLLNKKL